MIMNQFRRDIVTTNPAPARPAPAPARPAPQPVAARPAPAPVTTTPDRSKWTEREIAQGYTMQTMAQAQHDFERLKFGREWDAKAKFKAALEDRPSFLNGR